ncbi:four-carbon acid sugar kinase family protein [Sinorhizobium medicae]|nr:four-carbon acid sugar kinase family protein [Sinorhizobium medicae]MDX0473100.1 four-carbon acid sugar kinase family protein [Sinorhizobium medicae]
MSKPLLTYYGDDLTGSTDVMEALATRGCPTVLFTDIPGEELAARFSDRQAIGIAGTSRSETPEWMDRNLPPVFEWMKQSGSVLCHYKVCSTFDSSPKAGSIGRALDIGAAVFDQASTLLVVGAPELKRYTAFGHLFAHFGPDIFRIDRHPVMARHPVTPADEADLRQHLMRQTRKTVGLVDFVQLKSQTAIEELKAVAVRNPVALVDVLDEESKVRAGQLIWASRDVSPFIVGSSGVEYALVAEAAGTPLAGVPRNISPPRSRGPIAVVSGSCSPTTERQIRHAMQNGFEGIHVDPRSLVEDQESTVANALVTAGDVLASGKSPLFYTAIGQADYGGAAESGHAIGSGLGRILAEIVGRHGLRRAVVAGGDTSSHAIRRLAIQALELLVPLPGCPGSPLCTASTEAGTRTLEIAFKGGQVGTDAYFTIVRDI